MPEQNHELFWPEAQRGYKVKFPPRMSGELLASQLFSIFIALFVGIAISAAVVLTRAKIRIQAARLESAFMLAIANDASLWQYAWGKNVILVGPSTLLFAVRTIAHVWKQEYQTRHSEEIAARGADLYDKLVGFVADLEKVGDRLNQARDSYDEAKKKLASGRGNLIRQAEMLRDLGVAPNKSRPVELVENAEEELVTLAASEALVPGSD